MKRLAVLLLLTIFVSPALALTQEKDMKLREQLQGLDCEHPMKVNIPDSVVEVLPKDKYAECVSISFRGCVNKQEREHPMKKGEYEKSEKILSQIFDQCLAFSEQEKDRIWEESMQEAHRVVRAYYEEMKQNEDAVTQASLRGLDQIEADQRSLETHYDQERIANELQKIREDLEWKR